MRRPDTFAVSPGLEHDVNKLVANTEIAAIEQPIPDDGELIRVINPPQLHQEKEKG